MDRHAGVLVIIFAGLLVSSSGQENQRPEWDEESAEQFAGGVSEDTETGKFIGQLKCEDPEDDPIEYGLTSGTVVRVLNDGRVFLKIPLDFEKEDAISYDLIFFCVDVIASSGVRLHDPVEIRTIITANDANDNAPEFRVSTLTGYSFFISEDDPIDTVLTPRIDILDEDRGSNAVLDQLYIICDSPNAEELVNLTESSIATCTKFAVNFSQITEGEYTANLVLKNSLDFEDRRVYSSKLIAVDGGARATQKLTTTVNIQISVRDAQDVGPLFTNIGTSASVNEKAQIGSTVADFRILARDGDLGDKRPVKLTIEQDTRDAFDLSPATLVNSADSDGIYASQLIVKNQLDRESITTAYQFVVKVTELDKDTLAETDATATATYSVFITDANDNAPVFSQEVYTVNVTEVQSPTPVQINGFRIECNDPDEPTNARYRVRVISESYPIYSLTPDVVFTGSANIFLKVADSTYLDYDNVNYREQTVVVEAYEVTTPERLTGSTTVLISLQDINDNAPKFSMSFYSASIMENIDTFPYKVIELKATDKDSGINANLEYVLNGHEESLFQVNSTSGEIFLLGPVNYEESAQYVFMAYVRDTTDEPKYDEAQVTVEILNFNDEGPEFLLPDYQTSVNENSLEFFNPVVIKAEDNEQGTTQITYRIVGGQSSNNAFTINSLTGELTLRDFLDYEDSPTGSDGEPTGVFRLLVEASDNGSPPQTNIAPVVIRVNDINDHSPIPDPKIYTVKLSEIASPGDFIVQINGTDDDSGDFGTITYRIGQGLSDNFIVNPSTGRITVGVNRDFDYDAQKNYVLQVIASDGGAPQKSATATVNIEILDGNNKPPVFSEPLYQFYVDEKTPVNTVVETIKAVDSDTTAQLEYFILSRPFRAVNPEGRTLSAASAYDFRNAFGVNAEGGIYVKNKLQRELANEIAFALGVRDINTELGSATATAQVTVLISGEAITNITFEQALTVYMNEDADEGYNAITVIARDPNNNAVQNYMIINARGSSSNFDVKANGRITLIKKVDYEQDPQLDHLHRVVVRAVSNDGLQSATTTATISIVDVNDNPPRFQPEFYEAEVPETFIYPMEVTTIFAVDDDSRSYGPLEFRISGGLDSDDFAIFPEAPSPGSTTSRRAAVIVAPNTKLDYNKRSQYDLDITVVDNVNTEFSSARLSTNARLTIKVIDENNNSPSFVELQRSLAVPETTSVGQSIATLVATDKDFGQNGDITYTLEARDNVPDSAAGLQLFTITPQSGTVRVQQELLGRGGKVYSMIVRARDRGDRPNSGTMQIDITVQSTVDDDGNPNWISPPTGYILLAPEETPFYVLRDSNNQTRFLDATARTGTGIVYSLSDVGTDASSFSIDRNTGEITIVKSLDREQQQDYNLLVFAGDTDDPDNIRSGRQFVVRLIDKDDNNPTFENPMGYSDCEALNRPLIINVRENMPAHTRVYVMTACDPDQGNFGQVTYNLYNGSDYCRDGNAESILYLNETTGELFTTEVVDFEQRTEYIMCIRVMKVSPEASGRRKKRSFDFNQLDEIRHDVAYIQVAVIDENDNGPRFSSPQQVAVVNTRPGSDPVITLKAFDPDGPANNRIVYRVTSSVFIPFGSDASQVAADVFTLGDASGALYPALPSYQRFSGGRFVLSVRAIDGERPEFSDGVEVVIYVHEAGQVMKIILGDTPAVSITYSFDMIQELDSVDTRYSFKYLQLSEHRTDDGTEPDKTDVCFVAVNEDGNTILDVRELISLLDSQEYRNVLSKTRYNQVDRGLCYPSKSSEDDVRWKDLWWVLVAVAVFIFVCCLILIVLVVLLYSKYRRYMETRQTYLVGQ